MASRALPIPIVPSRPLAELIERQRTLALYGMALLMLALVGAAMQILDPRMLASGVNVWVKPVKFLVSVGVFALTAAWFFGYIRPERRGALLPRLVVVMLIGAGTLELLWIGWQAGHGLESHFNNDTPFFNLMYALMGLFAVILIGSTLPLAWEIARRPAAGTRSDFIAAVAIGLVLTFLLGGGLGGYMSAQPGHDVGATGGHVPLFGWNRSGGDLRVAHFLGIHAEQAIPILAALVAGWGARLRWAALGAGTVAYVALTLAVFAQAVAGRPLLPL
ncbi:MAG TPA: hypothetical protein VEA60_04615 [Allosphingosinicella sp.]|nr:hypothetical protein [Allosphingosinicella sp.]